MLQYNFSYTIDIEYCYQQSILNTLKLGYVSTYAER